MLKRQSVLTVALAWVVWVLFAAPLTAAEKPAEKPTVSVAHIKLSGTLEETPVAADPLFGISPENFKSKLDRIKQARKDGSIRGLYLQIEDVGIGWGKLDELSRALHEFRKSGKKEFAYQDGS